MHHPKSWNFGKAWIGPFEILPRKGVTYHMRSKDGKPMMVRHNNLRQSVVPANKGVPDSQDISILEEPVAARGQ